jgi:hypothetical protein
MYIFCYIVKRGKIKKGNNLLKQKKELLGEGEDDYLLGEGEDDYFDCQ